jgi:hypothetical protein
VIEWAAWERANVEDSRYAAPFKEAEMTAFGESCRRRRHALIGATDPLPTSSVRCSSRWVEGFERTTDRVARFGELICRIG